MRKIIEKYLSKIFLNHRRNQVRNETKREIEKLDLLPLTEEEKKLIYQRRNGFWTKPTFKYWEVFKKYADFNPNYIATDDYMPIMLRVLNPAHFARAYQFKGTYPVVFKSLPIPQTYLNVINGVWYDSDFNVINDHTLDALVKSLQGVESFIFKPTAGTYGGIGVKRIRTNDKEELLRIVNRNDARGFICQEVVEQSSLTSQFCETSINTFRITTLNINGRCTAENILFRHGRHGSVVDNGAAGGIMVGVDKKGHLKDYGYDKYFRKYYQPELGGRNMLVLR